jgi:dolichol-phosphate mannosyltransferase
VAAKTKPLKMTVVVPVFNNAESLPALTARLIEVCNSLLPKSLFEILFIDDGSKDNSIEIIETLILENSLYRIRKISLSKNYGQVAALMAGYSNQSSDCCVTISADLQDPPEKITDMYHAFLEGANMVACFRLSREDSILQRVPSRIVYRLARIKFPEIPSGGFDFFLMSREAVEELLKYHIRAKFLQGALLSLGFNFCWIPYTRLKRPYGKSQWSMLKKFRLTWSILVSETFFPIRVMTVLGGLTFFLSGVLCTIIAVRKLFGFSVFQGYPTLIWIITLFGGASIMSLGIISEYIIRIIENQRNLPIFRIQEKSTIKKQIS